MAYQNVANVFINGHAIFGAVWSIVMVSFFVLAAVIAATHRLE